MIDNKSMEKTLEQFEDAYVENDIVRWKTNDRCPFDDMLDRFMRCGLINSYQVIMTNKQRSIEAAEAIKEYVAYREEHGYSDEERFEMRAAFGDEKVVDCFTGKQVN